MKNPAFGAAVRLPSEEIEIIPLDLVPSRKRSFSKGPVMYGGPGSLVGRPVLLRVSAAGIHGWGEVRPINPWVAARALAHDHGAALAIAGADGILAGDAAQDDRNAGMETRSGSQLPER